MMDDYRKSNREKAIAPKLGKYWCSMCDRCLVAIGSKCNSCGARCANKKLKKDT